MKNFLTAFSIFISLTSFSQFTSISQQVEHETMSTADNGCISVRLEINYTFSGSNYTSVSSMTPIDPGTSLTLYVNIPSDRGVNIVSKQIRIQGSNDTHVYTLQNTNYDDYYDNLNVDYCQNTSSEYMHELETVSPALFKFGTTSTTGVE